MIVTVGYVLWLWLSWTSSVLLFYRVCSKYLDRQARENSVEANQTPQNTQSAQGMHFLPVIQAILNTSVSSKSDLFVI